MHIICPHCTTSYAINPNTLGSAGRTVRCSRCKETWLARPEDAIEILAAIPETDQTHENQRQSTNTFLWKTVFVKIVSLNYFDSHMNFKPLTK